DRFMLKIPMDYPNVAQETELARRMLDGTSPERVLADGKVSPVITSDDLLGLRKALEAIVIREELIAYLVELTRRTRQHDSILVGAGPRATQALLLGSRAHAAIQSRDFVTPDDIRALAVPVLGHRIVLRPEYEIEGLTVGEV